MGRIATIVLLVMAVQDPDRSTPEKTVQAYVESLKTAKTMERLDRGEEARRRVLDSCRTDASKLRQTKRREDSIKGREDYKETWVSFAITGRTEGKDGSVAIEVTRTIKKNQKDYKTNKVEEIELRLQYMYILEKSENIWLIRDSSRSCDLCKAKGTCTGCNGSGKSALKEVCGICKGNGHCTVCNGDRLVSEGMGHPEADYGYAVDAKAPDAFNDLSTPENAARTFADLKVNEEFALRQIWWEGVESLLKDLKLYWVERMVKKVGDRVGQDTRNASEKLAARKPKVVSVTPTGDVACALLKYKGDSVDSEERQQRIVLRKTGDKWLVDAEQDPCWTCKGTGKCPSCHGFGKAGDKKCRKCDGGSCKSCAGEGYKE